MNVADMVLAIVWIFFFIRGYFRGLVQELGALAALVCAFYLAKTYSPMAAPYLTGWVTGSSATAAAYILIFVLSLFAVWMLVLGLAGLVKVAMVQWADRLFGGVFGLAKGVMLTAAILFIYIQVAGAKPEWLAHSKLAPLLDSIVNALSGYAPPALVEKIKLIKP